jgi:hypothetical protein
MTLARARLEALILLTLSISLASFLWLSRGRATSAERQGREAHVLPVFEPASLRKIVIASGELGQAAVILRRNPGTDLHDYRLGESVGPGINPPAADRAEIAGLLRTLDFATFLRTLSPSEVPESALGRVGPRLKLEVEMDSVSYRVTIGEAAQQSAGARYARTTGDDGTDRIGVVPESLVVALAKDARELLGRLLFPYAKSQTKELVIERELGQTKLRADALGFRVSQAAGGGPPGQLPEVLDLRADPSRVEGLFFQLARAGMEAYPSAKSQPHASFVVVQVPESGPAVRVEIGGECAGHPELVQAVRTAPDTLAGCTSPSLLDVLQPRDLTLHGPWSLAPDEIDHIVVKRASATLDLMRDGAAFRLLSPDPGALSLERGNEYLDDLTGLVLERVPCQGDLQGTVRVVGHPEGSSGGREIELQILASKGTNVLRRTDDGACLLLTDHASWLLDPSASWYESLEVLNVRADDVLGLRISGPTLGTEELRLLEGRLTMRDAAVDEALLAETLQVLAPLRAQRIAERAGGTPWQPELEVQIEARGAGPFTLRIGPRVRGGYLAELAGRRTQFILSPEVVRTLETSLLSRAPAQWNPEAFTELSVRARGVTYRLRRIGGELVPVDDSPPELGPALALALSALVPESAVRRGGDAPQRLGPSESLQLDGLYDPGDGHPPRKLSVKFGGQVLHADRTMQLMTVGDDPQAYFVDRAAVLSVLDLL